MPAAWTLRHFTGMTPAIPASIILCIKWQRHGNFYHRALPCSARLFYLFIVYVLTPFEIFAILAPLAFGLVIDVNFALTLLGRFVLLFLYLVSCQPNDELARQPEQVENNDE
jgi:hypothetical protein